MAQYCLVIRTLFLSSETNQHALLGRSMPALNRRCTTWYVPQGIICKQSASERQRFQPRYNRIRGLVDGMLREMPPIQQPAHRIERGRRLYTGAAESVPALKSCQSTGLRKVGGIAKNEDRAISASAGRRQRAKYGFGVFCGLAFLLQLRAGVGAQDGHWSFLIGHLAEPQAGYALGVPRVLP
jgi:hypothetical protein